MIDRVLRKRLKKAVLAVAGFAAALFLLPWLTIAYVAVGLIDVLRNERKDWSLFDRYFLGNGIPTWLLSPLNLLVDMICHRNRKIYRLEDFPEDSRRELEEVLEGFRTHRDDIIRQIDASMGDAKRGMFLYRWFGKRYNEAVPQFNKPFRYVETIAVSIFDGNESTSSHFGPLRLTLRVLYNLIPAESEDVFIEVGNTRHYWHENPLFIFDDTLRHRSVNGRPGRRYCVFVDVARPSPFPRVLAALQRFCSDVTQRSKAIFYRRWKMLDGAAPDPAMHPRPPAQPPPVN